MAYSIVLASKQPDEKKTYTVNFDNRMNAGATIAALTVVIYEWDERDQVQVSLDKDATYPTAITLELALLDSESAQLFRQQYSMNAGITDILCRAYNEDEWQVATDPDAMAVKSGTIGWGDIGGDQCGWVTLEAGVAGQRYKATMKATTTPNGQVLEADLIMDIENA